MASGRRFSRALGQISLYLRSNYSCTCSKTLTFHRNISHRSSRNQHFAFDRCLTKPWNLALTSEGSRFYCTSDQSSQPSVTDPYSLVKNELSTLSDNIKEVLQSSCTELEHLASYHFSQQGKAFRPLVVMLLAKAFNQHSGITQGELLESQRHVAEISEMIHTSSLVHDDVIDAAETRRGDNSIQHTWGQRKAILTGDYILAIASMMIARIRHEEVVEVLSQVLEDLVRGEFMQLGSKEDPNERFAHYLKKTFKKTASLVANSCKAVALLAECSDDMVEVAYQYGRNLGIAFQLVDDLLDFISSESLMGKPVAADLKLGLATAPVLFAAQQHPELEPMIMRRFSEQGDVDKAWYYVSKSDGIAQTRMLAEQHCKEAIRLANKLTASDEKQALITITHKVLNRLK